MRLKARLARLETAAPPPADPFPGHELLHSPQRGEEWLARHGFADALEAWEAGVRGGWGGLLELAALRCWLRKGGHASAAAAWLAGAFPNLPDGLEPEARKNALVELYHLAGDAIVLFKADPRLVTSETIREWQAVGRHLANPTPDDALLDRAMRLVMHLYPIAQQ